MQASTTARKASTTARWAFALLFLVGVSAEASAQEPADSATSRSGRSVDATALPVAPGAGAEAAAMEAIRERLAVFGDWFHRAMDLECSGRVPVARLVEITNPRRDQPQQIDWNLALDVDDDGFVEPGEVPAALWQEHEQQVDRNMGGDVDGDEALTPREYALGIPDPGAERNEERLSARQEAYFADLDTDGDRRVTRSEMVDAVLKGDLAYYWGRMVAFHLRRADSDGDGAVIREELTGTIEAAGGSVAPEALDVWFEADAIGAEKASTPRLVLSDLPFTFRRVAATAEARARLEAPLAPLMMPDCGRG